MDLPLNHNEPLIMHIDLNSCFARVEQQANPLLRGRPVGIAAYISPAGCVVSPSVEAKQRGVRVGMTVRDARMLSPDIVILPPDPAKYRYVHQLLCRIFRDYSPMVTPKSIDEAIIDFAGCPALKNRTVLDIAEEIKARIRHEIGTWVSCSIGIAPNRFWAKTAASLIKPNGLEVINHKNAREILANLSILDLCGINTRYQARLNTAGIFTPLEFLDASRDTLIKQVFYSINGHHWYLRLRGWETDAIIFDRKSFGNSYALGKKTDEPKELSRLLMKLCEKTGSRMRGGNFRAYGVLVSCLYNDFTHWHKGRHFDHPVYTTHDIYLKAQYLLNQQQQRKTVRTLAVSCYDLENSQSGQQSLFEGEEQKLNRLSDAIDAVNNRYGQFVITPAVMVAMDKTILDRISFGGVKELEEIYY